MTMLRMSILPRISSWKEMDDEEDKLVETEGGPKSIEAVAVRRLTLMRTTLLPHLASWSAVAAEEAVCIRFLLILVLGIACEISSLSTALSLTLVP